jgi:succinyl-CoA synthetase beta subunit
MNIHEYQAKEVLAKFGVPVPKGQVAFTAEEAKAAAEALGGPIWVVKSQIHAGGRGKGTFKESPESGGGVRVVKSIDAVVSNFEDMVGKTLVTHQNAPEGGAVKRLYIEDGSDIQKEYYISMVVDRGTSSISIIASSEGGMDIETVAEETPEKIVTVTVDPAAGLQGHHLRTVGFGIGMVPAQFKGLGKVLQGLYDAFVATDAEQIEINPLAVVGPNGDIIALDAKIGFDDNALFRHKDIEALRDVNEEDPYERRAAEHELSYVKMDGTIGCMVNGAGLAMATMDIIKMKGAEPANFLDVGGGATKERVTEAFKIILSDPAVEGILVNIFGGIMRCDVIAEGVIAAARDVALTIPLVVRLEGTNVEKGKEIMANSGLAIIPADNLEDAAEKIVAAVKAAA